MHSPISDWFPQWQVDSITGLITPVWTNPAGTEPTQDSLSLAYYAESYLLLTTDFAAFNRAFGGQAIEVVSCAMDVDNLRNLTDRMVRRIYM